MPGEGGGLDRLGQVHLVPAERARRSVVDRPRRRSSNVGVRRRDLAPLAELANEIVSVLAACRYRSSSRRTARDPGVRASLTELAVHTSAERRDRAPPGFVLDQRRRSPGPRHCCRPRALEARRGRRWRREGQLTKNVVPCPLPALSAQIRPWKLHSWRAMDTEPQSGRRRPAAGIGLAEPLEDVREKWERSPRRCPSR